MPEGNNEIAPKGALCNILHYFYAKDLTNGLILVKIVIEHGGKSDLEGVKTVKTLVLAWTCLLLAIPSSADIIYVKQDGTGSGTSWSDPNGVLQIAINNANYNDEVWVAAGTYTPTIKVGGSDDRYKSFQMKSGVVIYGGFPDTGNPDMTDRDPNQYETILSGDIAGNDIIDPNKTENSYHVVTSSFTDPNSILDGFTITAGNASGTEPDNGGGGIYNSGSITVVNCVISDNYAMGNYVRGAAISNWADNGNTMARMVIINCTISGNHAIGGNVVGGCIYNNAVDENDIATVTITNSILKNNSAEGDSVSGGVIYSYARGENTLATVVVTDSTFSDNSALANYEDENLKGGVIINFAYNSATAAVTITNSIILNNHATAEGEDVNISGGIIYNYALNSAVLSSDTIATAAITNCLFSGNSSVAAGDSMSGGILKNYGNSGKATARAKILNSTFCGNSTEGHISGSVLQNIGSGTATATVDFTNNTLSGNLTTGTVAFSNYPIGDSINTYLSIANSIIWDSNNKIINTDPGITTVNYSCIQDWDGGGFGNIVNDPLFADPNGPDGILGTEDDNLRLLPGSPCIDAGDNDAVHEGITTDLDGLPRFYDDPNTIDTGDGTPPIVDMGAHEFIPCDFQPDGRIDELDLITFILYWLDTGCGRCGGSDLTGEGDVNISDFAEFESLWQAGV